MACKSNKYEDLLFQLEKFVVKMDNWAKSNIRKIGIFFVKSICKRLFKFKPNLF